jgi:hypothetical protein
MRRCNSALADWEKIRAARGRDLQLSPRLARDESRGIVKESSRKSEGRGTQAKTCVTK